MIGREAAFMLAAIHGARMRSGFEIKIANNDAPLVDIDSLNLPHGPEVRVEAEISREKIHFGDREKARRLRQMERIARKKEARA